MREPTSFAPGGSRNGGVHERATDTVASVGRTFATAEPRPRATATSAPTSTAAERDPKFWSRYGLLIALLLATIVVSVVVRHVVYPALSWNRDEATYLWQVRALRDGQLLTTTGGLPQFFQPWLTGIRDGQFFSQYTLGWPAVMFVADLLFGSPAASIAFGTAVAVFGAFLFVNELTRDRVLALVSAMVLLASPMVITQSGVYLSYLFSLGVGLSFGAAMLAGLRRHSAALLLVAGFLLGVAFVTRPYDAVLWALALGGLRGVHDVGRRAPAGPFDRLARARFPPVLGGDPRAQPDGHRDVHPVPVLREGAARQVRLRVPTPDARRPWGRLHGQGGDPGRDDEWEVRPAVPRGFVRGYRARRHRPVVPSARSHHSAPGGTHGGVPGRVLRVLGKSVGERFAFLSGPVYLLPLFVPLCLFIATALLAGVAAATRPCGGRLRS